MKIVNAVFSPPEKLRNAVVFFLFLAMTLLMTYPLLLNIGNGVRDMGDPLLNTWIISWDIRQISKLNLLHFFDANIFYPHLKTLAYSEHLFPLALAGLPIKLLSGNPLLTHNIVLLLAFITSGFAMYLLSFHLTKSVPASVSSGIIYAFSPFMLAHLFQIQVISAAGIPLSFLYLHKFFEQNRFKDLLFFSLFYILQVLANGYYAMYLTLFGGIFFLFQAMKTKRFKTGKFWVRSAACGILIILFTSPFYYQYLRLRREMGFSRNIGAQATITSFLATSPINRIYGRTVSKFQRPEGELFPGALAFLLALTGILSGVVFRTGWASSRDKKHLSRRILLLVLDFLIIAWGIMIIFILVKGGFEFVLGPLFKVSAHHLKNPLIVLILFAAARGILGRKFRLPAGRLHFRMRPHLPFYLGVLVLSFLFTFGSKGPYLLLYKYVPGFNGLRVASRFHVFVMFSLALCAAFGICWISAKLSPGKRKILFLLIPGILLAEYFSAPIPLQKVPVKDQIPLVYRWLSSEKEQFAVIELPLPRPGRGIGAIECPRVYFSSYHWKNLVNGYSGYFPPLYDELRRRWNEFPLLQNILELKELGVRFLIIHSSMYGKPEFKQVKEEIDSLPEVLRFHGRYDDDFVYEILYKQGERQQILPRRSALPLSRKNWKVHANIHDERAFHAIDESMDSRWDTGPQKKGHYFQVDLGDVCRIKGLSLKLGLSTKDYPRGFKVEVSRNGMKWKLAAESKQTIIPLTAFLDPKNLSLDIYFSPKRARYIRITNTGEDDVFYWSIYEMDVLTSGSR